MLPSAAPSASQSRLAGKSLSGIAPLAIVAAVGVIAVALLPAELLPRCPIHAVTGLLCPGCGTQSAVSTALHGHWDKAWSSNQLIFFVPTFALLGVYSDARKSKALRLALVSVAGVAVVSFTIWRNLA